LRHLFVLNMSLSFASLFSIITLISSPLVLSVPMSRNSSLALQDRQTETSTGAGALFGDLVFILDKYDKKPWVSLSPGLLYSKYVLPVFWNRIRHQVTA
jgi:hypothetical protein